MLKHILKQNGFTVVILTWFLTQLCIFFYFGIYTSEEAEVYINIAGEIVNGNFNHSVHYVLYAGYIFPLVLLKFMGLPFEVMYLVQLILSFAGVLAFLKMLRLLGLSKQAIWVGGFLFATCPFFHAWNSHLYTDGYFGNIVVIFTYLLLKYGNGTYRQFLWVFALLVFASFVRPVGFLLALLMIGYLFCTNTKASRMLITGIWLGATMLIVKYSLANGKDFFYPNHNLELNVICGLSSNLQVYETKSFEAGMSIPAYFVANPKLAWHLFTTRLFKSIWMTRPYFSSIHNALIAVLCVFYYLTALPGIISVIRKKIWIGYYFISGMVIWLVPNVLFCTDWHNRFIVPFMPFLLVLCAYGIEHFYLRKVETNITQRDPDRI